MVKTLKNLRKILDKRQISFVLLLIIGAFIVSLLEILSLSLAIPIVGFVTNEANTNQILDLVNHLNLNINIDFVILVFFLTYIFKIIFTLFISILKENFIYKAGLKISHKLLKIYLSQPFLFFRTLTPSHLVRNLSQEVLNFISLLSSLIIIFSETIILFVIFTFLLFFNVKITLTITIIILISVFLYNYFFKKKIQSWAKERQGTRLNITTNLTEAIKCIREIKLSSKEDSLLKNFFNNQSKEMKFHIRINIAQLSPRLFFEFIMIISVMLILLYGFNLNKLDNVFSTISIFILSGARFIPSFSKIVAAIQNYRFNSISSDLMVEELNLENQIPKQINEIEQDNKKDFKDNLTLNDICFNYKNSDFLFKDINLEIKKNQKILLTGESGSGKSTLLDLLAGLIKPTNGNIILDNEINIYDNFNHWKNIIAFVAQENFFFNKSIKENITQSEIFDEEKFKNLVEKVDLTDVFNKFPQGVETIMGESGIKLSGGQLQRLAIIRAIYSNPKFIILDECTSALDSKNEKKVLELLNQLDTTIIFSSHKTNIEKYFDRTFKIENKKLIKIN